MGYYEFILSFLKKYKNNQFTSENLMTMYYMETGEFPTRKNFYKALRKLRNREDIYFYSYKKKYIYRYNN